MKPAPFGASELSTAIAFSAAEEKMKTWCVQETGIVDDRAMPPKRPPPEWAKQDAAKQDAT